MWQSVKGRLDRRWKRVAFIFWAPLAIVAAAYALLALYYCYQVFFATPTFWCHRQAAGFIQDYRRESDPTVQSLNKAAVQIAHERSQSRFAAETRTVEASPEFRSCITQDREFGSYWLNYRFLAWDAFTLSCWAGFFALLIFPRFWRTMSRNLSEWINVKPT